jgi:hypothetical protein
MTYIYTQQDLISYVGTCSIKMLRKILQSPNVLINRDSYGITALMVAIAYGRKDAAEHLLENGADANLAVKDGNFPLLEACMIPSLYKKKEDYITSKREIALALIPMTTPKNIKAVLDTNSEDGKIPEDVRELLRQALDKTSPYRICIKSMIPLISGTVTVLALKYVFGFPLFSTGLISISALALIIGAGLGYYCSENTTIAEKLSLDRELERADVGIPSCVVERELLYQGAPAASTRRQ